MQTKDEWRRVHLAVCVNQMCKLVKVVSIPLRLDRIVKLGILVLNILNASDWPLVVIGKAAHDGWLARDKNVALEKKVEDVLLLHNKDSLGSLAPFARRMRWFTFATWCLAPGVTCPFWRIHDFVPFLIEAILQAFAGLHAKSLFEV